LHINVRSLLPKIDEIRFIAKYCLIDCLSINESMLAPVIFDCEVSIDDFSLFRTDRDRNGGGVALYIKKPPFPDSHQQDIFL
jgi:hypothetical protein